MNCIVFTQDLPGERAWLNDQFPNCRNLETFASGLWPTAIPTNQTDEQLLWEVPIDDRSDVTTWPGRKIKSLYNTDHDQQDDRWVDADELLLNADNFTNGPQCQQALILLDLPRTNTFLLHKILSDHCGYDCIQDKRPESCQKKFSPYDFTQSNRADIFFVYRNEWWDWILSFLITYYERRVPNFSGPITITQQHLDQVFHLLKSAFNKVCSLRQGFRDGNFYIVEFEELVQNQHLTGDTVIKYNKENQFTNHDQMKMLFDEQYQIKFATVERRCLAHLTRMGCCLSVDFDRLRRSEKQIQWIRSHKRSYYI